MRGRSLPGRLSLFVRRGQPAPLAMFYGRQVLMALAARHPQIRLGPSFPLRRLRLAMTSALIGMCIAGGASGCGGGGDTPRGAAAASGGGQASPRAATRKLAAAECAARIEAGKSWAAAAERLPEQREAMIASLREVAELGEDDLMRANAALLLGSIFEEAGERKDAIGYYRQALVLAPDDPSGRAVLALALAADNQWDEAIKEQRALIQQVPDDLEAWLMLGEMEFKGGHPDQAKEVYLGYETRRRGLLEGLTRKQDGAYVVDAQERAGCAIALAVASDNGTALALAYALRTEPEASVRAAIAETMGIQRLIGYEFFLKERLEIETDAGVIEVLKWALAEIARDGVDTRPGASPVRPDQLRESLGIEAPQVPVDPAAAATSGGAEPANDANSGENTGPAATP